MAFSRFLTLTLLLTLSLFSSVQDFTKETASDFESCKLKYQVSSLQINDTQAFAVNNKYVLFYSHDEPKSHLIKRDPFLGLNLMKTDKHFKHIFKFYKNRPKYLAAVLPNEVVEGKLLRVQIGLNQLGKFSSKSKKNAFISGTCCGLMGLSTGEGIIDKAYIRHFLESKKIVYADIGIRVADKKGVFVVEVNPFFENSPFLLNDIILYMDKKKSLNAAQLSRDILFSKPGSKHSFLVLRNAKKIKLRATFKQRISGGLIPDSFFGFFGLELDENLFVKKDNTKYQIKKGDKLLFVMGKEVKTLAEIRGILSLEKNSKNPLVILLFKREGFDFFIHFDKPSNSI
ncbi:MAG: hypothetical protein COA44_01165 [Arcobacter sp.]|nr:MAG: hypothetical protein COA44_01165 [Arcobacter sp.]